MKVDMQVGGVYRRIYFVEWMLTIATAYPLRWAGTCDKHFLPWRTCTTAYRKPLGVAGKETWFLRRGCEL